VCWPQPVDLDALAQLMVRSVNWWRAGWIKDRYHPLLATHDRLIALERAWWCTTERQPEQLPKLRFALIRCVHQDMDDRQGEAVTIRPIGRKMSRCWSNSTKRYPTAASIALSDQPGVQRARGASTACAHLLQRLRSRTGVGAECKDCNAEPEIMAWRA